MKTSNKKRVGHLPAGFRTIPALDGLVCRPDARWRPAYRQLSGAEEKAVLTEDGTAPVGPITYWRQ